MHGTAPQAASTRSQTRQLSIHVVESGIPEESGRDRAPEPLGWLNISDITVGMATVSGTTALVRADFTFGGTIQGNKNAMIEPRFRSPIGVTVPLGSAMISQHGSARHCCASALRPRLSAL